MTSRISYLDRSDLPADSRDLLTTVLTAEKLEEEYEHLISTDQRNFYRAMANNLPITRKFRELGGAIRAETDLAKDEQEMVILSTARAMRSQYEWHQHVRVGLYHGLSEEEILLIKAGDFDGFDDRSQALLAYTAQFVQGGVTETTHDAVSRFFSEKDLIGIASLIGFYMMVGSIIDALNLEIEEEFVGWNLENL